MADKSTRLIIDALTRAAAEPGGLPLFAARAGPGLFPAVASARPVARRCQDEGLLQARSTGTGKAGRELCTITDKGLHWLRAQSSPRQVLEDFLRVLEEKQARTAELIAAARQMAAGLDALRGAIERIFEARNAESGTRNGKGTTQAESSNGHPNRQSAIGHRQSDDAAGAISAILEEWQGSSSGDCPLPELYRLLSATHAGLSIGRFHDLLRELHDQDRVYLHPWTGPLYELPEPPLALLVGHLVGYYASLKMTG